MVRSAGTGAGRWSLVAERFGHQGGRGTCRGHTVPIAPRRTRRHRVRAVPNLAYRVLVRGGGPLETLGRATTLVMDKTGTLTSGQPRGTDVVTAPGWSVNEVLGLAASADQLSPHVLASAIVAEARLRELPLSIPLDVDEEAGTGVSALVDGRRVHVGNLGLDGEAADWTTSVLSRAAMDGAVVAWVRVDGHLAGPSCWLIRCGRTRPAPFVAARGRDDPAGDADR